MTVRSCIRAAQASSLALSSRGHHQAYYKTVQAQGFSEDEDQNHADEQAGLLRIGANACVSNNADSQSRCQRAHAHGQTSTQVSVARICRIGFWFAHLAIDDDSGDEAVDTQDASHDNRDDGAMIMSGRMTPMEAMPTPDLAVPYAAPKFAKTIADVTPMKPKKADDGSQTCFSNSVDGA